LFSLSMCPSILKLKLLEVPKPKGECGPLARSIPQPRNLSIHKAFGHHGKPTLLYPLAISENGILEPKLYDNHIYKQHGLVSYICPYYKYRHSHQNMTTCKAGGFLRLTKKLQAVFTGQPVIFIRIPY